MKAWAFAIVSWIHNLMVFHTVFLYELFSFSHVDFACYFERYKVADSKQIKELKNYLTWNTR